MRILVSGEIKPSVEALDEIEIKYETTPQGVILDLDDNYRLASPAEKLKDPSINSESYPLMSEYARNDDRSLSNFIIKKNRMMASGDITKADNQDYDYVCNGLLRVYSKTDFYTAQWVLAGENFVEDRYYFINSMLETTEEPKKGNKM